MKKNIVVIVVMLCSISTVMQASRIRYPQVWHNGSWHDIEHDENSDEKGYFFKGKFIALTPEELAISERQKQQEGHYPGEFFGTRIWHNNAWHPIVYGTGGISYTIPVDRPIEGDGQRYLKIFSMGGPEKWEKVITLTPEEIAISKAKNKIWHNGAWHEGQWNRSQDKPAYQINGKMVTLTDADIATSDAKKQEEAGTKN